MWKYDYIDKIRLSLLRKNIIDLAGDVDEDMAMYVRSALMILATKNNPDLRVIITSDGGNMSVGLSIHDLLKNYSGWVTGEVQSFSRSMATVILQACDHRLALANSKIMIHNVNTNKVSLDVLRDPKKLAKLIKILEQDQLTINNIYSQRTGKPLKLVAKASNQGQNFTAQEALDFGLIDRII